MSTVRREKAIILQNGRIIQYFPGPVMADECTQMGIMGKKT